MVMMLTYPLQYMIPFRDKFVTRHLIIKQTLLLHVMLKQGKMCLLWKMRVGTKVQPQALPKSLCIKDLFIVKHLF